MAYYHGRWMSELSGYSKSSRCAPFALSRLYLSGLSLSFTLLNT